MVAVAMVAGAGARMEVGMGDIQKSMVDSYMLDYKQLIEEGNIQQPDLMAP